MTETCLPHDSAVLDQAAIGAPHLSLRVGDPVTTAAWWCRTLGFELADPLGGPLSTRSAIVVRHPDSGLVLRLRPGGVVFDPWAFLSLRVDSRQALVEWATHLRRFGVAHSSVRDNGDEHSLTLIGPEGIGLELWWRRPGSTSEVV